jgi:DNA-binding NarL/FixJ family response regulator
MTRILVVDDQVLFSESIASVISNAAPDFEVVGVALSGRQGLEMAGELHPDVVLLDYRMDDLPGTHVARRLRESHPKMRIILLTIYPDSRAIAESEEASVDAFLVKNISIDKLVRTIRDVQSTHAPMQRRLRHSSPREVDELVDALTDRELRLFRMIGHGLTNDEIAEEMNLAEQTVKNYASRLYAKLDVTNRRDARDLYRMASIEPWRDK